MRTRRPARTRSGATASSSGSTPLAQATAHLWAVCHLARPRIGAVISLCSLPPPPRSRPPSSLFTPLRNIFPSRTRPSLLLRARQGSPSAPHHPSPVPPAPSPATLRSLFPAPFSLSPPSSPPPLFSVPRAHVWITIAFLITPCKIQFIFWAVVSLATKYHHPPIRFPSRSLAGGHRL